jgi:antitoxin PrlF
MGYALTSKRQVTVPLLICEHLGIGPGREIEYELLSDGRVVISPIAAADNTLDSAFKKWRGSSKLKMTTTQLMRETRGEESMNDIG